MTVSGVRSIDVNRVPVVVDSQLTASQGQTIYIPYSSVLANDSDPDRDRLSITDFSLISSKGGRITSSAGRFTYPQPDCRWPPRWNKPRSSYWCRQRSSSWEHRE